MSKNHKPSPGTGTANGTVVRTASYSGPLPPPAILEQFESIVPGAAERIIAMAEEQSRHRMRLEATIVGENSRRASIGQVMGFIIGAGTIVGAVVLALHGSQALGALLGLGGLTSLVSVFVTGKKLEREERAERRKEQQNIGT